MRLPDTWPRHQGMFRFTCPFNMNDPCEVRLLKSWEEHMRVRGIRTKRVSRFGTRELALYREGKDACVGLVAADDF